MRYRYPAGIRIAGKPVGGRFVALASIPDVAATLDASEYEALLLQLGRDVRDATRKLDAALVSEEAAEGTARYAKRRASRVAKTETARALGATLDAVQQGRFPKAAKAQLPKGKRKFAKPAPPPEDESGEESAVEWAVGASYDAKGGDTSDVDISLLVRRSDGEPFGFAEAKAVMSYVREWRTVPPAYYMAAVDWRSPHAGKAKAKEFQHERTGEWRSTNVDGDWQAFDAVVGALAHKPGKWTVRMGGLK